MSIEGVDYAYGWRDGTGAKLKAAGKQFAFRYLSGGNQKDLVAGEIADLISAGVAIGVVWETDGKTGPLMGEAGGKMDATAAVAQAQGLKIPAGACIYFAVDFGATSGSWTALQAYFDACRAICHNAGYRCGDYGGLSTITGDKDHVDLEWQTYAWSGGQWDGNAAVEQYLNGQPVAGLTVDLDRALVDDFGQFPLVNQPKPQLPEDDDVKPAFWDNKSAPWQPNQNWVWVDTHGNVKHAWSNGGESAETLPSKDGSGASFAILPSSALGFFIIYDDPTNPAAGGAVELTAQTVDGRLAHFWSHGGPKGTDGWAVQLLGSVMPVVPVAAGGGLNAADEAALQDVEKHVDADLK